MLTCIYSLKIIIQCLERMQKKVASVVAPGSGARVSGIRNGKETYCSMYTLLFILNFVLRTGN